MKRGAGFTLIELLVVVTIIAVVSAIGLAVFFEVQKGVRDVRRKQDLRTIQAALIVYYQKNSHYPCANNWQKSSDSSPWIKDLGISDTGCGGAIVDIAVIVPFDTNYISSLPTDPKQTSGLPWNTGEYSYAYWSGWLDSSNSANQGCSKTAAQYYILAAKLEKNDDPDRAAAKPYYFCNGSDEIISRSELIPGDDLSNLFFITSQD